MKCKGCGGNFKTREMVCPYCGRENFLGSVWSARRSQAELDYEKRMQNAGKAASPYVWNRLLGRILLIEGGIVVLTILITLLVGIITVSIPYVYKHFNREKVDAQMEEAFRAGDGARLYDLMDKYEIFGDDHPNPRYKLYTQYAFLSRDYDHFMEHTVEYYDDLDRYLNTKPEEMETSYARDGLEYCLESLLEYGARVVTLDSAEYKDGVYEEIADDHQEMSVQVECWLKAVLHLTEEDWDAICDPETDYWDMDEYAAELVERRCWDE